ncbi:serine/threonine-protein kinase edr1 [Phtheirospermum japonicum]|uniref:Serine/threonine-protein kinase edr1 n=1 Tax=Phtheirospermum japonicum TaxID=374723 RepID=A0A830AWF0_9LAMI|nr:serine/threonine-protein kinase edr1 [Phtheirospermum japonicum]
MTSSIGKFEYINEFGLFTLTYATNKCFHGGKTDFAENFGSLSLVSKDENLRNKELNDKEKYDRLSYKRASQILWSEGMLSEPIPNGFYSVVPDKRLKELYDDIPTLEELHALELDGLRADVILVDADKDRKLSMLKQLIVALVKGLNTKTAAVIKKIAGLVSDFYKRPNSELSPKKAAQEEASHLSENRGVQMLGQIRHGSCRPRAILFKVLADTVGLECRLVVGLPTEGASECVDSHKHMSVLVVLNSVEFLVDLMRFPGQLIPLSTKAIFMTHISAAGESDSAENDSCDSPMEPNSPLYGVSERVDPESAEKEDGLAYQRRLEASLNAAGPSLRNMMLRSNSVDRKLSLSHSEPNIAATFWRRSRRKVIAEQRTASSSPEHPSLRARGRSMLSGDNKSFRDYSDDIATSRSEGATSDTRRIRRRSISMTPEIGDDIVSPLHEQSKTNADLDERPIFNQICLAVICTDEVDYDDKLSGETPALYAHRRQQSSQSLPSSPHEFRSQTPERCGTPGENEEMISTWNRVLDSPMFQKKPLLPFDEWNIDFSELTVGTRVGIGEHYLLRPININIDKAEGFFGEVFRGIWNGTEVAIKLFLEQDLTAENMEDFCNEISILSYFISWCLHKTSTTVNDHRIHGNGFTVLFASFKWSEEETELAEKNQDVT